MNLLKVPNFLKQDNDLHGLDALLEQQHEFVQVDDVGIIAMDMIEPGRGARMHCTFWDRRLRGREFLCRRVMQELCDKHDLRFAYVVLDPVQMMLVKFCERVGMRITFEIEDGSWVLVYYNPRYLHGVNRSQGVS